MSKDRDYYRCMSERELREAVRYGLADTDWQELAIALAERLDTIRRETLDEVEG